MTILDRLRRGLGATRSLLAERMGAAQWKVSSAALEEVLLAADVGVEAAEALAGEFERARSRGEVATGQELEFLRGFVRRQLAAANRPVSRGNPHVTLVVGVNGTGKTTTAAKLAAAVQARGGVPLLVAADTFRAAAVEQLQTWGGRLGVPVISHRPGADPGAVVFDALQAATSRGATDVFVDTAGRLHTKHNLMAELDKVRRVCSRAVPGSPHEVLLVMDASTGINGLTQAREFRSHGGATGVVLTKLDGTAKGGVVLAVARELELPVRWIGVGEAADDLLPFDPEAFTTALLEGLA
ncbi:MAG: signal recognition particle-docking protein FtsY [Thermoanaerobaculaceae bacterium]|nr:signal recognition particle-docking protein FtsY [Thermoanaerobaculaceae bacterium]